MWIEKWEPEDPEFWASTGRKTANRNLVFSILTEHIGFSIWSLWAVMVLFMGPKYGLIRRRQVPAHLDADPGRRASCASRTTWPSRGSAVATGQSSAPLLLLIPTVLCGDRHAPWHVAGHVRARRGASPGSAAATSRRR